jgi:hypothetical protein
MCGVHQLVPAVLALRERMEDPIPPRSELKIDMLNTSIGSCCRQRGRNHFLGFLKLAFGFDFIVISFSGREGIQGLPNKAPTSELRRANQSEKFHRAMGRVSERLQC